MLTNWQKVILINYGIISNDKIARILNTQEEIVEIEAKRLGIDSFVLNKDYVQKGFVTIIRNNYNLISNEDIAYLIDIDINRFNELLKNYDFLDIKLGKKPAIDDYHYYDLYEEEKEVTLKLSNYFKEIIKLRTASPFDFYSKYLKSHYSKSEEMEIKERFTAPYAFDYLNVLDNSIDEEYLDLLKETGTTGIWISGNLRDLSPFEFDLSMSKKYEENIKKLDDFVNQCKKHNIDVYLYLNEPRSLPEEFFNNYKDIKGNKVYDGSYVFCFAKDKVIKYLYDSTKYLISNVPNLKGIMTITMSENPTHCFYKNDAVKCHNCPFKNIYDVPVLINNTMMRAIRDAKSKTTLIANLWGWAKYMGFSTKDTLEGIKSLDKDIAIMCVSEFSKKFVRNGKSNNVIDYSISVVGPSDISKKCLTLAKELGHKTYAKIQINNSWECSAVPYIPVFNLMEKHIRNVKTLGVDGLMLGWSLGGYPGGFLPIANMLCQKEEYDTNNYYLKIYDRDYAIAVKAIDIFSKAFKYYPFDVSILYLAPHTLGPANLWTLDKEKKKSTMVCYSYNDIEDYLKTYGVDGYLTLMNKLLTKWKTGIDVLNVKKGNDYFVELKTFAKVTYIHLLSAYNTVSFYKETQRIHPNIETINQLIDSELRITKELYELVISDSRIGFEMTNHYYYLENNLLLKISNLLEIKNGFGQNNL